jgi:hypothetical protein
MSLKRFKGERTLGDQITNHIGNEEEENEMLSMFTDRDTLTPGRP